MNYAPKIVEYLSKTPESVEIILAPNAPPVVRKANGLEPMAEAFLTAAAIRETLTTMRGHSTAQAVPLGKQGTFSLGQPNIGRLRISFMSQRGSYVVRIVKIPFQHVPLENLLLDPSLIEVLDTLMSRRDGTMVIVTGSSDEKNRQFVYSALQRLNSRESRLIYVLEQSLSYLLQHDRSIVFQSELDLDVESVESGLAAALQIVPDVVYVGDVATHDDVLMLLRTAERGVLVIMTLQAFNETEFMQQLVSAFHTRYPDFIHLPRKVIKVKPVAGDKLAVTITDL